MRSDAAGRRVGRIVELEAYIGTSDLASHARFGLTERNRVMFGPPGIAYVYLVYGMYDCLNIVTEPAGRPAALLVRAVEPLEGVDAMRAARIDWLAQRRRLAPDALARGAAGLATAAAAGLARGPGLVGAAFSIDRSDNGRDLCDPDSPLRLEPAPGDEDRASVVTGRRVGIGYAGEPWTSRPWRFAIAGNASVTVPPFPRGADQD